ncbi:MAG: 4'-phosphopantetheinyl transferase superfamily protein [Ruminococcus sp.]|nr:4'-phosphopantetheinyl transferase superfamily protein [Ruminococcus sp.]
MRIYLFDEPQLVTGRAYDDMIASLPEQRRQKALRYRSFSDRVMCGVSYRLLEYGLRKDFGIESFSLDHKEGGKPFIAGRDDIFFNISHCKNGCVCTIAHSEAGVDIQHPVRLRDSLIKRVCSDAERALIAASDDPELTFRGIWCMKEAYLKMLGVGIATDMKKADTTADSFPAVMKHFDGYTLAAACEGLTKGSRLLDDMVTRVRTDEII